MLFFRSEEDVHAWCAAHGYPVRPTATMTQLWGLATAWYATRLQVDGQRPQADEIPGIFANLGLVGNFWNPLAEGID